jgi:hypothetical protein
MIGDSTAAISSGNLRGSNAGFVQDRPRKPTRNALALARHVIDNGNQRVPEGYQSGTI